MSPPPEGGGTFVLPNANVRAQEATSMSLYAACDLHSNNTVLAIIDDTGALRCRQRLPNELSLIDAALAPSAMSCRAWRSSPPTTPTG